MRELDPDVVPHLSRFFFLRRESDKVVYAYLPHQALRTASLHPCEAVALALIDGERSWRQVAAALSAVSGEPPPEAAGFLARLVSDIDPRGEIVREAGASEGRRYAPEDFLVPAERLDLESRLEAPFAMILKPTSRCKTNCLYCYAPRQDAGRKREMSLERILQLLREAHGIGVRQVNLCGGDGFARSDFLSIVEEAVGLGFVTDISTKVPLTEGQARRLAASGLDYLQVSIDSADAAISDKMVGRRGHHAALLQSIRDLKAAGLYVRTNTVVTRHNVTTMAQTVEMLAGLGIDNIKISPAFPSQHLEGADYVICEEEAEALEEEVARLQRQWGPRGVDVLYSRLKPAEAMGPEEKRRFWFHGRGRCSGGRSAVFVTPEGKVTLCEQVPHHAPFVVGDLAHQSLLEVWNSPEALAMAYPERAAFAGTLCENCSDFDLCAVKRGHCFRDSWFAHRRLTGPSPYCPHNRLAA
ncbi:radical SAM protein [Afifella pfennigii]|uniref:radical SAM protein n=1 Tax=Afifella pfennigii TaxID=209897 RepID=UPI00146FC2F8|nr:radical SAM protein [Afifella pfennigii]